MVFSWLTAVQQLLTCTLKGDGEETHSVGGGVSLRQQAGNNPDVAYVPKGLTDASPS